MMLVAFFAVATAGAWQMSDYVNIVGGFNNWGDNGKQPNAQGITVHTNLAIGTTEFKVKVWNGSENWYGTGGKIQVGVETKVNGNVGNMTIEGATAGEMFDVQWDLANNTLLITRPVTEPDYYITGSFNNWDPGQAAYKLAKQSDGTYKNTTLISSLDEFVITQGDWGTKYASNGSNIEYNTPYTTQLGAANNIAFAAGTSVSNATVTFNPTTKVVTVTGTLVESTPHFYLVGDAFTWDVPNNYELVETASGSGQFEITQSFAAGSPFKICTGNTYYTYNDSELSPEGGEYTLYTGGTNNDMKFAQNMTDAKLTFIPAESKLIVTPSGLDTAYPTELYLIGTLNEEGTWTPEGTPFEDEGDNMFTIEATIYPSAGADLGYFGFSSATSAPGADDWTTVNAYRYGASDADQLIDASAGEAEVNFSRGQNAWSIEPGVYKLTVSFDDNTLTVEYVDALPSGGNFPDVLYFAQPFGTIPAAAPQTLKAVSDGVYQGQILISKAMLSYFGFYTDVNGDITKYGYGSPNNISFSFTNMEEWPGEDADEDNTLQVNPTTTASWYIPAYPSWASDGNFTVTVDLNTLTFTLAPSGEETEEPAPEALYIYGNTNGYQANARYTNVATLARQGTATVYSCTFDVPACGPFTADGEYGPADGAPNNGWYFYISDNRTSNSAGTQYQAPLDNFLVSLQQGGVYSAIANSDKSGMNFIVTNPGNYSFEFDYDTKEINITLNEVAPAISLSAEVPAANVTGKTAQLNWTYEVYNASGLTNTMLNVSLENVNGGNEQQVSEEITGRSGSILLANLKDGITYRAKITVSATAGGKQVVSNVYTLEFTTPEIEEVTEAYLGVTSDGTFPEEPDKSKGMELSWRAYNGDQSVQIYSFSGTFTLYPGQGVNVWGPSGIMTEDPENPNPFPGLQPMGPDGDGPQDLFFKTGATEVSGRLYPTLSSYWVVKNTIPVEVTIEYDQETGFTLICNTDVSDQVEGGSGEVPDNNGMKVFIAQSPNGPDGASWGQTKNGITDPSPSADDVQLAYVESEGVYYGYATFASANGLGFNRSWRVYTAEEAGVVINYYTSSKASLYAGSNFVFDSMDAVIEDKMVVPSDLKTGFAWNVKASGGFPNDAKVGTVYMVIDLNTMTAKFSLSPFQFATPEPAPEVSLQPSASDGSGTPNQSGDVDNEARTITLQTTQSTAYVYLEGVPEGASVYFKLDNVGDIASGAMALAIEGYVLAEQTTTDSGETEWRIPLTAGTQGDLSVYYELDGGVETDPVQYSFIVTKTTPTGVDGINAEEDGAEYFTLQGVKVLNPEKGIYIRVLNGKADKVVL